MSNIISYKDLVLNTMLDTIKRERRHTIDNVDIMNFEGVISQIIKHNELNISIGNLTNGNEFTKEIGKFVYLSEETAKQTYTLLPWISEEELEASLENTIFSPSDMEKVHEATKEYLRFSRNYFELYHLNSIDTKISINFMNTINSNIKSLEQETEKEKEKLQKVKNRIRMGG